MKKINVFIHAERTKNDDSFKQLLNQGQAHVMLQDFWQAATPESISHHSFASGLDKGILTVLAFNNAVAAKIRLSSASLLTQLHKLQKTKPTFYQYKLTAIKVKVQVKSQQSRVSVTKRTISGRAAATLRALADDLGDSPLAEKLNQLADKA